MGSKQPGVGGCKREASGQEDSKKDNLVVLISNESRERSPVDIKLFIDGELKVDASLETKMNHRLESGFFLTAGKHTIKAISGKGETEMEQEFTITEKHWMAISYYYSSAPKGGVVVDPVFTYRFENEQIYLR